MPPACASFRQLCFLPLLVRLSPQRVSPDIFTGIMGMRARMDIGMSIGMDTGTGSPVAFAGAF